MPYASIDFSKLVDEEVLFFIRIRGKKSYFNMVYTDSFLDQFDSIVHFRCISEYKKDADIHIDLNSVTRDYLYEDEYNHLTSLVSIEEIIIRCRALRDISYVNAKRLISRTYLFFSNFYKTETKLKLIVTGAVDNYVMDLMHRLGVDAGIKFIGVTDSFMSPQYKLITIRGELNYFSSPSNEQIDEVIKTIKSRATSTIVPSLSKALRQAIYDVGSYVYRFIVRYCFKYLLLGRLEYEYQFAPKLSKLNSLDKLFAIRYLKPLVIDKLDSKKKTAYVPLHYYPEATVDYWVNDPFHIDYYISLFDTIKQLTDSGFQVIVKEHPAYFLARPSAIYKELNKFGCQIVSPFVTAKEVIAKVDLVVVWNGSTGIEAIINQKPVVKVTNSYYGENLVPGLNQCNNLSIPSMQQSQDVIKKVLETSFRTC